MKTPATQVERLAITRALLVSMSRKLGGSEDDVQEALTAAWEHPEWGWPRVRLKLQQIISNGRRSEKARRARETLYAGSVPDDDFNNLVGSDDNDCTANPE
jgi:hypothetical protein